MSEILSDPATLDVLKDPWISKLVKNLKDNPPEARRLVFYLLGLRCAQLYPTTTPDSF
jgi:hypothetical protein